MLDEKYLAIWQVVASIPPGKVATYGQVARLAGLAKHARLVGYALHQLGSDSRIPWHRVINAKGLLSFNEANPCYQLQKVRLEQEGIVWMNNAVSLAQHQWRPTAWVEN